MFCALVSLSYCHPDTCYWPPGWLTPAGLKHGLSGKREETSGEKQHGMMSNKETIRQRKTAGCQI